MPNEARDLWLLVARYHGDVHRAGELRPTTIANMLQRLDAYRKPARFNEFLQACSCDFHGRPGFAGRPYPQPERLLQAFEAAKRVDAGAIAADLNRTVSDPPGCRRRSTQGKRNANRRNPNQLASALPEGL